MTKETGTFNLGVSEDQSSIWIGEGSVRRHLWALGRTGRGKYDELLKELEPTKEQKKAAKMQEQAGETRKAKRLAAICEHLRFLLTIK